MSAPITVGQAFQHSSIFLLKRVRNKPGQLLNQASVDTIELFVFDANDDLVDGPIELNVADVIFDTLQTDWDEDRIGYNFSYEPAPSLLEDVGTYHFECWITDMEGRRIQLQWKVPTVKVRTPE